MMPVSNNANGLVAPPSTWGLGFSTAGASG